LDGNRLELRLQFAFTDLVQAGFEKRRVRRVECRRPRFFFSANRQRQPINTGTIVFLKGRRCAIPFRSQRYFYFLLIRLDDLQALSYSARRQRKLLWTANGNAWIHGASLAASEIIREGLD